MADPLATQDDVTDLWRPLTAAEQLITDNLCGVASAIIRARLPLIDQWITDGLLDVTIVRYVVVQMIKAAVEDSSRPVGAKSVSQTAGIYQSSVTYEASANLSVEGWLSMLTPLSLQSTTNGVGSARLKRPGKCHAGPWAYPQRNWHSL